ncbi:hypothetical protein PRZ48_004219 [Zasmidium cellare]|uniref:FAD dependent oxidoreductase domain-containing protein n=1 Tax=Zasmidium cellare TaxID=395010 RepID=A0ABR0EX84_ZASCE|nr:hypothetical protein PRZ48_004219 [Zasmidium cellare]
MPSKDSNIIVVGAGVFGLTLALELKQRGYQHITILDRHAPPVPDGSSVDISRVVRADYADPIYMKMGMEAEAAWQQEYSQFYRSSGILITAQTNEHPYITQTRSLLENQGAEMTVYEGSSDLGKLAFRGSLNSLSGYSRPAGGWVDAKGSIGRLAQKCADAGVYFVTGASGVVRSFDIKRDQVKGVILGSGEVVPADQVILATGAWTTQLVDLSSSAIGTCHPVGFIQLTSAEVDEMKHLPIAINLTTGFFVFPPTQDTHLLKFARHGYGFESRRPGPCANKVSSPKIEGNGAAVDFLPADAEVALRDGLRLFHSPSIAERQFVKKRLCWYTDTPKGDFIVDHHSTLGNLFLATGGSGQ